MVKKKSIVKVVITWIQEIDGKQTIQTRRYSDYAKAKEFVDHLPDRGIVDTQVKIIMDIHFE